MPGYYGASAPAEPGTNRARRPNLVQSMFDQTVAAPAAGYQNPGAMLPGIAGDAQPVDGVSDDQRNAFLQSTGGDNLPAPAFASPPVTGQTAMTQPGQLNALARGGLFSGGSGPPQQPAAGSPPPPAIFNGSVAVSPSETLPLSASPNGPPPGYRRMIMADGSPGAYQLILPGERTANGQDAMRQGTSMAEIQQANPGMSPAQLINLHAQMQRAAGAAAVSNFGARNETANRNSGVMSNADAVAQGRNTIDMRRVENEEWSRSPAGRRAIMEQRAYDAYNAQPPGAERRPLQDFIRDLAAADAGGLMGAPPSHGSPPSAAPNPIAAPSLFSPPPAAASPPVSRYNPNAALGGAGPSYAPLAADLDRIRASLPVAENTVGTMLSRLNRDNASMIQQNPAAIRAYLQDRYGSSSYSDAARGVQQGWSTLGVGPMQNRGFWGRVLHLPRVLGHAVMGGSDWTPDLEGRSLAQALDAMVNGPSQ